MNMQWEHGKVCHPTRNARHSYKVLAHALNGKQIAHVDRWEDETHTVYVSGDQFHFENELQAHIFVKGMIAGLAAYHLAA
jgi:hypothetical protein